ncbi:Acyl-CoA synthetase (AMP-forming)/AMP-acid ligase II [Prevotella aff. ruminicola Tc2-24]|uniref:Acyl-CoA synthetase (AMP-forming)/AMP-acid ligase II n=1 Tax=Prevotella aff. ruminicola Tc2-24 TaxID=81582 RepID=A0A1I0M7N7_9BACT|nr:AMP-binding protein [Prevotella aff. ruminicola Tc2-24]SEV84322.1 Acyl-CoA synthetase (AMP-forming)/AMP-acid ligase II [Prevotella aff. ruminicola Tc2-24]
MILNLDKWQHEAVAAIDAQGSQLTYGGLRDFAVQAGMLMPARSLFFLLVENNVGGIAWTIGNICAGNVPLILNAHLDEGLYKSLFELYQPPFVCMPEAMAERFDYEVVLTCFGYTLMKTGCEACPLHEDLSHLLPTSGSTGSPKLVRHQYANIEAAALNISTFFELTENDRPLMVLPLYYTMGLSMVFSHLYVGATILITNQSMTDRNFWRFMKEEHATSFTGVPYSFEILNLMRFFRMDLPDLTLLTQGGGRMTKELNLKFAEFCRDNGKRWIATYGQSECTARMAWLPAKWAVEKVGSIGIAVPNGELSLIDMDGQPITTPHTEGEMCYRGKNVTMGYARKRDDLLLGDERHGFIRTGDLAYFDEDGCYYIVGRMGRFLKLFGMRVGLDECERIVKGAFPGLECACVGTDEKMLVYLTDESYKDRVKEELVNRLKLVATSFEVRIIPAIPKNEAGKTLYAQLSNQ